MHLSLQLDISILTLRCQMEGFDEGNMVSPWLFGKWWYGGVINVSYSLTPVRGVWFWARNGMIVILMDSKGSSGHFEVLHSITGWSVAEIWRNQTSRQIEKTSRQMHLSLQPDIPVSNLNYHSVPIAERNLMNHKLSILRYFMDFPTKFILWPLWEGYYFNLEIGWK